MTRYDRNELDATAREFGFARDTFEKVLRLKEILIWVGRQDLLKDHFLLKGGTAINLTILDLPRLSVDIDMDFTPNYTKEDMMAIRKEIGDTIISYMQAEGYMLSTASRFHQSLDAYQFKYSNVAGNRDMIKLELNYSLRSHILKPAKRTISINGFSDDTEIMTVDPMEIFAAKTNALLTRAAARDLYDFNTMVKEGLFEDQRDLLRKCVVFYASITQEKPDGLFNTKAIDSLTFQKIRRDLFPVLRQEERRKHFDLDARKKEAIDYIQSLMILTEKEKEYLNCFNNKKYLPELLFDDPDILERVRNHPMALWKCKEREKTVQKSLSRSDR